MKSYIQGLVTGGVLIFAFMVLTGQKHGHKDNHGHHDIDDIMHKLEDLEDKLKKIEIGVYCYNVEWHWFYNYSLKGWGLSKRFLKNIYSINYY